MDETLLNMVHLNLSSPKHWSSPMALLSRPGSSTTAKSHNPKTSKRPIVTRSKNEKQQQHRRRTESTTPPSPASSPRPVKKSLADFVPPSRGSMLRGNSNVAESPISNKRKMDIAHLSMGNSSNRAFSMAFMCGNFDAEAYVPPKDGKNVVGSNSSRKRSVSLPGPEDGNKENGGDLPGRALCDMSNAQSRLGNSKDALKYVNEALCIQRKKFGEESQTVARTLVSRGVVLASTGQIYDSVLDIEKAARIQKRVSSGSKADSVEEADTLLKVGTLQHERGNFVEAIDNFEAALSIRRKILGPSSIGVAQVLCIIGRAHHQRRRYLDAVQAFSEGILIYKQSGVSMKHPDVAWVARCMKDKTLFAEVTRDYWNDSNAI